MNRLLIIALIGLLFYGIFSNPSGRERIKSNPGSSRPVACCSSCGTTRCVSFQAEYRRISNEFSRFNQGTIPAGLILPSGQTVRDRALIGGPPDK